MPVFKSPEQLNSNTSQKLLSSQLRFVRDICCFFLLVKTCFAAAPLHSSTWLSFRAGTPVSFSKLESCQPPSTVGNTLWTSISFHPIKKN